jgi:hypothetical protein
MTAELNRDDAPPVSPADLQAVCTALQEFHARSEPGQATSIDIRSLQQVCSPGADAQAVWARTLILRILDHIVPGWMEQANMERVIELAARFPMKTMQPGIEYNEPPFDVREFMKEIATR